MIRNALSIRYGIMPTICCWKCARWLPEADISIAPRVYCPAFEATPDSEVLHYVEKAVRLPWR
jgi:hypothetical protein